MQRKLIDPNTLYIVQDGKWGTTWVALIPDTRPAAYVREYEPGTMKAQMVVRWADDVPTYRKDSAARNVAVRAVRYNANLDADDYRSAIHADSRVQVVNLRDVKMSLADHVKREADRRALVQAQKERTQRTIEENTPLMDAIVKALGARDMKLGGYSQTIVDWDRERLLQGDTIALRVNIRDLAKLLGVPTRPHEGVGAARGES